MQEVTDDEPRGDVEPVDLSKACGACQNLEAYWADKARRGELRRRLEGAGSQGASSLPATGEADAAPAASGEVDDSAE